VTVSKHQLVVQLNPEGIIEHCLKSKVMDIQASNSLAQIEFILPVQLRRCGIETKLVLKNGPEPTAHPSSVKALQRALLKALIWNQELITGERSSPSEIAKRENVTNRHVTHLLKLSFLSPEIIRLIMDGKMPASFNLEALKTLDIVDNWGIQKKMLIA
jgi:hypothetical protein